MLDGTLDTHFTSGQSQTDGDWIGLDLRDVRPLRNISIHQGRNDVNDSDYFDNVILEASADGKQWTALSEPMAKTYVIKWSATTPVDARFVRIRRLESDRKSWATVREFVVNPVTPDVLRFKVATPDSAEAMRAFDNDPTTSYTLSAPIEIDAPKIWRPLPYSPEQTHPIPCASSMPKARKYHRQAPMNRSRNWT